MSIPAWILETWAAVMILVAEVSAGQLVMARAWTRRGGTGADVAVSHLLTGIALVGILVPGLSTLPNTAWEIVFAVITAWFVWRLWRERRGGGASVARGHHAPQLVHSAAMLYLFAALAPLPAAGSGMSMSGTGGMTGMTGMTGGWSSGLPTLQAPTLALICALLLIAFTVHDLDRQADAAGSARRADAAAYTAERLLLSPAAVKGCQVATGVTIAFTLIIMI